MLFLPENASSIASLIGIDPGTSKLGVGIIRVDLLTKEIVSSDADTLIGKKLIVNDWMVEQYGERFARIEGMGRKLKEIFVQERAYAIASESPFFNRTRPGAFEALVEILTKIRQTVKDHDPWIKLQTVPPSNVKNGVGAAGGASKDPIREAIMRLLPFLKYDGEIPIENLDDNAIDGLAVAYWLYQQLFVL